MFGISKLRGQIEEAEDRIKKLEWQINNPPPFKVGDVIKDGPLKGNIISKVWIREHRLSDMFGGESRPYRFEWNYMTIKPNK